MTNIYCIKAILGTGPCQEDIIPQSLPIFKRFIQGITRTATKGQGGSTPVATQIRGCLKRFLAILANAQKRETEASLPCVKNTLLASTILVTSSTNVLPPTDPLVTKLLDEIVDCLSDRMVCS
jgi:HEAT repeat-containing protein 5